MKKSIKNFFLRIISSRETAQRRAAAISLGVFIAFSPFLGIQTFLIFIFCWVLRLNTSITFAVVYLINNPWTMLPIAAGDYIFGFWLLHAKMGYDLMPYNPNFMDWVNRKIGYYIMKYLCVPTLGFWYYILGGLMLASILSLISYPVCSSLFTRYMQRHENNNAKQKSLS